MNRQHGMDANKGLYVVEQKLKHHVEAKWGRAEAHTPHSSESPQKWLFEYENDVC